MFRESEPPTLIRGSDHTGRDVGGARYLVCGEKLMSKSQLDALKKN